ncbi:hypothetical protein [Bacillus cereus]|uniref:hypothetical protein n=1 Tax=Bacillus cereus TaxID=1396 RepID=UPI0012BA8FF5|nr:hypothetical protein [Bacillus cereus]
MRGCCLDVRTNTDRMWWMIGTVVVGVILIAGAKLAYPEVFNSVIDSFKSTLSNAFKM